MRELLLLVAVASSLSSVGQIGTTTGNKSAKCEQAKEDLKEIETQMAHNLKKLEGIENIISNANNDTSSAAIEKVIAWSDKQLDEEIMNLTSKINAAKNAANGKKEIPGSITTIELNYITALRSIYNDVKTRRLLYGKVEVREIKTTKIKQWVSYYVKQKATLEARAYKDQVAKRDAQYKLMNLDCDSDGRTSADNEALEEAVIAKILGGWTDKPTPWGTPGGGCQIVKEEGKLVLINEFKDHSGASISVNSDGTASISATKWPVTGKIDKACKTIKWSNGTTWTR